MLVRAARRKAQNEAIPQLLSAGNLYLPWLCPRYNTPARGNRRYISGVPGSNDGALRKRRNSRDGSTTPVRRAMATALNHRPIDATPMEEIPMPPLSTYALSNLRPFDPLSPLLLGGALEEAPQRYRIGPGGVGGEILEILSLFEVCLQVGRVERAGNILKRISKVGAVEGRQLLSLHNQYLRATVQQIIANPSDSATQDLHKWFELEIRNRGVPHDAETVAYMLKAALQSPKQMNGDRRDRLVQRYMGMVQGDAGLEVLSLDILTAEELNEINHICPTYNLTDKYNIPLDEELGISDNPHEPESKVTTSVEYPIPNIRPTDQKGLGLKSLKKSLSLFSQFPASGVDIGSLSSEEKREIQARLEQDAVDSAMDRWREESTLLTKMGLSTSLQTKSLGARMWAWHTALDQHLKQELLKADESEQKTKRTMEDSERCFYGPYLRTLPTDKIAAITILSCMSLLSSLGADKGLALSNAIMAIANALEEESVSQTVQNTAKKGSRPSSIHLDRKTHLDRAAIRRATRLRTKGTSGNHKNSENSSQFVPDLDLFLGYRCWPMSIKAKLGAYLMSSLIEVAKVPVVLEHPNTKELVTQMQPAFSHAQQHKMGRKIGIILANSVLVESLKREPVHSLLAKQLPMLVAPEPWTNFSKGGFIAHPSKMMRIKLGDKDQRHYAEAAISKGDMEQTFRGLDVLGKTGWRINQPVFDVMVEVWNSGEGIANIAPETPNLEIPAEPEASQDPLERRRWIRAVKLVENARSGVHSQRCFQNFQLEIAKALRDQIFYFPHNVDFRGRAYPIPPYLNHMGADHCRGILTFSKGKPLGNSGLRWLKIHLANVYGFDKASLPERETFATEHLADIFDSASQPLNGARWWLKAEDPWQCLAACMELKSALDSPDPTAYVSHLPIHQDGTCNGLQHYAALGGDTWGARQVNLEPADRPADVYSAVANLVKESISKDKELGNPFAEVLDGKITRKVVKQTVMTNVYGVTFIGARAQVRKQLVAAYPDLPNDEKLNPGVLAAYVATKIFTALSSMFRGAHDIQFWFGDCASRISLSLTSEQLDRLEKEWPIVTKAESARYGWTPPKIEELAQFKTSVIWTTPLHMPVVQPYRELKTRVIETNMQRISLSEPHRSQPVSKRKQLQGFPPNFIHSLDATHMLLSALQCDEQGLSFAAVHDSFWTHAADIDAMNGVLRDTFVRIHSEDVIGRLAAEFTARYKNCMYMRRIRNTTPLYKKIKAFRDGRRSRGPEGVDSLSFQRLDELLLERKRLRLLSSSDPKDVERGKKMVTPASLFLEMGAEGDVVPEEDFADVALGRISTRDARTQAQQQLKLGDALGVDEISNASTDRADLNPPLGDESIGSESEELLDADDESRPSEDGKGTFEKAVAIKKSPCYQYSWVWLPLTFPPVPKKGEFDVTRLKNSLYFFS